LKAGGHVRAVGVGAKNWQVIRDIDAAVPLDWVMLANSLTIYSHPPGVVEFLADLTRRGIGVINSAVFNAGFLVGGRFFDYREPSPTDPADQPLFAWREKFLRLCREFDVPPATACVQFALTPPGVAAVAMNTSNPAHVAKNAAAVNATVSPEFWTAANQCGVVSPAFPHL
jgi:D-threo-aldose 1-dehydrogenase